MSDQAPGFNTYGWMMIVGLRDFYRIPSVLHTQEEVGAVAQAFLADCKQRNPGKSFGIRFNIVVGKVSFMSTNAMSSDAFDGAILYGGSNFSREELLNALSLLAVHLAHRFGQPLIEVHIDGKTFLGRRDESPLPTKS